MYAVDKGALAHAFGHDAIGQEHEFLNKACSVCSSFEISGNRMSLLVGDKTHLGPIKVNGTTLEAVFAQGLCDVRERKERLDKAAVCFGRGERFLKDALHLLVGKAAVGTYDGVAHAMPEDTPLEIYVYNDGMGKFLLVWTQGTEEVAQTFRQHGDGAIDKIDTGGSLACFAIDGITFMDVVGDIGNVDAYFVAATSHLAQG